MTFYMYVINVNRDVQLWSCFHLSEEMKRKLTMEYLYERMKTTDLPFDKLLVFPLNVSWDGWFCFRFLFCVCFFFTCAFLLLFVSIFSHGRFASIINYCYINQNKAFMLYIFEIQTAKFALLWYCVYVMYMCPYSDLSVSTHI